MTAVNRFIAPIINPKTLDAPTALEVLSAEDILAERMDDFVGRAEAGGLSYDVGSLETDPVKISQTTGAHREMQMRTRVNNSIKAVLPAYAQGADLEQIAARAGVGRIRIYDDGGGLIFSESDTSLLVRYLASFAAPAAGSPDAYIYHALSFYPDARDVSVLGPDVHGRPGEVVIVLLAAGGAPVPGGVASGALAYLKAGHRAPLTDVISVLAAQLTQYSVHLRLTIPAGPDPAAIVAAAVLSVRNAADGRYAIGSRIWMNAIEGAGYVGNVLRVARISPSQDIDPGPYGAAYCASITIDYEVGA